MNLLKFFRQIACRHQFKLGEQSLTGIADPSKPALRYDIRAWEEYYASLPNHPSHTQRIQWPCAKCGKVFFAHCGLEILAKHGRPIP